MNISLNEKQITVADDASLHSLRDQYKPDADVVIHNGHPVQDDVPVADGDKVVLIKRGEAPSAEEMEALLLSRHTPGVHAKLKKATVGIAGVGGLGSAIAIALARSGVGRLILADFDIVEPSNLNRQQYFVDQLGLPKVDALKENLKRINPYVQAATFFGRLDRDNIPQVFNGLNVMVEAFDAADQKAMLVETFRLNSPDVPLVAASGLAGHDTANSVETRRAGNNFYLVGDGITGAEPGRGLMAPRVGVAAHHQANAVLRLLLNEEPQEMEITVNGKLRQVDSGTSLGQLLEELNLDCKRVVVERNLVAVLRDDFANIKLNNGDSLEIVQFVGGG